MKAPPIELTHSRLRLLPKPVISSGAGLAENATVQSGTEPLRDAQVIALLARDKADLSVSRNLMSL